MITYIYVLICPIDEQLKYIGKANSPERRVKDHLTDFRGCEYDKALWIRKLKAQKLKPELLIISEVEMENWKEEERFYIEYFKYLGIKLVNSKPGGNGLSVGNHMTFKKKYG